MDKNVVVFRVLHGYNQVVGTFQRKVLAHRHEVRDAKLSAKVDGLGGSKTVRKRGRISMKMMQKIAPKKENTHFPM